MSAAAQNRGLGEMAVPVIVIAVALIATLYLLSGRERPLASSAMGHDAVVGWLKAGGLDVRGFAGAPVKASDVGLRILPLLDTDLGTSFVKPQTREAYLKTGTEIDIHRSVVDAKLKSIPTLLIAPKWQRGARLSGYAHASLLLEPVDASHGLKSLALLRHELVRPEMKLLTVDAGDWGANTPLLIYAPQLFPPDLAGGCAPVIDTPEGALLIRCDRQNHPVYVLSDPDLLNNHGLMLGDNAGVMRSLVADLADGRPVLFDTTNFNFMERSRAPYKKREWSDLLRFFAWPFSLLWGAVAALLALALWRSALRFGPVLRPFDDRVGASSKVSVAAKARLMRLAGNDAALLAAHVDSRLGQIAADLFGPHRSGTPHAQIAQYLIRRTGVAHPPLIAAADAAQNPPDHATPGTLQSLLARFEQEARKVTNDPART